MKKVVFICTGNTCRSPMAAAIFQRLRPDVEAASAGLSAAGGEPANANAVAAMAEMGLDIAGPPGAAVLAGDGEGCACGGHDARTGGTAAADVSAGAGGDAGRGHCRPLWRGNGEVSRGGAADRARRAGAGGAVEPGRRRE